MKSELIIGEAPKKYPYLGRSRETGLVVLFTADKTGVALSDDGFWAIGEYSDYFKESNFDRLPEGSQVIITQ